MQQDERKSTKFLAGHGTAKRTANAPRGEAHLGSGVLVGADLCSGQWGGRFGGVVPSPSNRTHHASDLRLRLAVKNLSSGFRIL